MQKIVFLSVGLCLALSACNKLDNGVEIVGKFADAVSGFEGSVTFAATGAPASGLPLSFKLLSASGDSLGFASQNTKANGAYAYTRANKDLPALKNYVTLRTGEEDPYRYYWKVFTEDSVVAPEWIYIYSGTSVYGTSIDAGRIKKIDIQLYDASLLEIRPQDVKTDYTQINFTVYAVSPATGDTVKSVASLNCCLNAPATLSFVSKPVVPIKITAEIYRNSYYASEIRTYMMAMDQKDNYLQIEK